MTPPGPEANQDDTVPERTPPTRASRLLPTAAVGAMLVLCLLGATVGWITGAPSRIEEALDPDHSARSASSADRRSDPGSSAADHDTSPSDAPGPGEPSCESPPLSVVAAEDIAGPVRRLAGSLADGQCPKVTVTGQDPAATLAALAGGGRAPDVWIPDSTLWLRLAAGDGGEDYPTTGDSIARTPVVIAFPQELHEAIASDELPLWSMVVDKTISGEIPRMSMPDRESAAGALALVSLNEAMRAASNGDETGAYFRQTQFRNNLAAIEADVDALLQAMAESSPAGAGTEVGVFPATEQQLLAYQDRSPAVPVHGMGTHDATIEADYPMVVSGSLGDQRAGIANKLLSRLQPPSAVQRLVEWGFRPPSGSAQVDTGRFPDYPAPMTVPDAAGWHRLVDGWLRTD